MSRTHRRARGQRRRLAPGAPFGLSDHAVDQFRARVAPQLTIARCWVEAKILARSAQRTEHRTPTGSEIWIATDGEAVRFVVNRDADGRRTCVTVLGPAKDMDDEVA